MAANNILIIDDDARLSEMLGEYFSAEGLNLTAVASGTQGLREAQQTAFDLIILDVMLPGLSGFEVLRQLRDAGSRTPVLMLTARTEIADRVEGLDAGADDYLAKPFALEELLARMRALLRRSSGLSGEVHRVGDLTLAPDARLVTRNGEDIALTKTEFDLLELLVGNAGVVLSRERIYEHIWGYDFETTSNSLDVYIGYLRRKTEAGGEPRLINTMRGVGYVLRDR